MTNLNWRKAKLQSLRSVSVLDEQEHRERDAAAQWLERNAKKAKPNVRRPKRRRAL